MTATLAVMPRVSRLASRFSRFASPVSSPASPFSISYPRLPGDPELAHRRERDALVEHREAVARDLVEERPVDRRHDEARALAGAVFGSELRERRVIVGPRALGLEFHQLHERLAAAALEDVLVAHAEAAHLVLR